jgi:glycosyltransferase involved in cell wall biosynthesis
VNYGQTDQIAKSVQVHRVFALDAARHLSIRGVYPQFLARPDRWISWALGAIPVGLLLIRRLKPDLIWSTFPIATAHRIALTLSKMSGIPWVADFRDSMTEENYPSDPSVRMSYRRIESATVRHAQKVVFTTPGTLEMYRARYPEINPGKWTVISNGYDEESFIDAESGRTPSRAEGGVRLLHSGILYPNERDPSAFLEALYGLREAGDEAMNGLHVTLRATGHDDIIQQLIQKWQLTDVVQLAPPVSYLDALGEMLNVDGLLIFQAGNCNHQIPAKIYEYFRAQKPILALTDPAGDTALLMQTCGLSDIARIENVEDIQRKFREFVHGIRQGSFTTVNNTSVRSFSRKHQAAELAMLMDEMTLVRDQS